MSAFTHLLAFCAGLATMAFCTWANAYLDRKEEEANDRKFGD